MNTLHVVMLNSIHKSHIRYSLGVNYCVPSQLFMYSSDNCLVSTKSEYAFQNQPLFRAPRIELLQAPLNTHFRANFIPMLHSTKLFKSIKNAREAECLFPFNCRMLKND